MIETALVLLLLLVILIGIAEFARAWYTKNSLKNAVRQGARVAAVTNPNTNFPSSPFTCTTANTTLAFCQNPASNAIITAVCCQPGVPHLAGNATTITVTCFDPSGTLLGSCSGVGGVISGGTVQVSGTTTFLLVVGGSPWPWPASTTLITDASMRYE